MTTEGLTKAARSSAKFGAPWCVLLFFQFLCILTAFYRGFRAPSLWSLNYYQVSWADGFLRRGLLGTLLLPLGCRRFDPHVIWVLQFAVLAAALILLLRLARRGAASLALCVFFLSSAGTLFFNEIGYPDQLLLLFAVACMGLLVRRQVRACAWLMAAALLVHEEAAVMVLPLVAVQWLRLPDSERPDLLPLVLPSLLVLVALVAFSTSVPFPVLLHYDQHSIACGHPLGRRDFLLYYAEPFGRKFRFYYHPIELWLVVAPLIATVGLWIMAGGAFPKASRVERGAAWLACCLPLALGYVGTDKNRWVMMVLLQLLLLLGTSDVHKRHVPGRGAGPWMRLALALPLLLVVFSMQMRLFDRFVARPLTLPGIRSFGAEFQAQFSHLPVQ
ncbi:MAG: hypothetical protein ACREKE_10495 [bacterium]